MALPISWSNVKLYRNIPWRSDYKHTRYFGNRSEQSAYFNSLPVAHTMSEANYQIVDGNYTVRVNAIADHLMEINYLTFKNQYSDRTYYCFVTKIEYVNKGMSNVHFQLDLYQTWYLDTTWKPSYVLRDNQNPNVINTVDEGLDYGTMYDTVFNDQFRPYESAYFLVIVTKNRVHGGSADPKIVTPKLNGVMQPLSFYIVPMTRTGEPVLTKIDGTTVNITAPATVLEGLYKIEGMVNNIVSLYITTMTGLGIVGDGLVGLNFNGAQVYHASIQDSTDTFNCLYVHNVNNYLQNQNYQEDKHQGLPSFTLDDKKFYTHPYSMTILDDMKGNRMEVKNEYINDTHLRLRVQGSLGTSSKISYAVRNYNTDDLTLANPRQVSFEHALVDNNSNDVPIITDMLSAYLQGNRNSIQNQQNQIYTNGVFNAIGSGVGILGSALSRDFAGATQSTANLAQGTANTFYSLEAINAKQQDINNIPPSLQSLGKNSYFDFGNEIEGIYILKKLIKSDYRKRISDFWKMFGWKQNELKTPNLRSRDYWNYIHTSGCLLSGSIPQDDLVSLQGIFDNGITLWHTNDVGNYNLVNGVR